MRSFWTTADLKARGKSARDIARAVEDGLLLPVRPGWWAVPGTSADLIRAVRVGGAATGQSAARARGLWTPPDPRPAGFRRGDPAPPPLLRVAIRSTSTTARLRDPSDASRALGKHAEVVLLWVSPTEVRESRHTGMLPVLPMLRDVFRSEEPERALAVVDSALHHRHLLREDLAALAAMLPQRLQHFPALADGSAQSGTETIVRVRLRFAGLRVVPQATVAGMGHGDLLVEDRVLVEVDGREWHDDDERFEEDRRRDLVATLGRYRVLRFSWYQVLFRWPEVEAAVFAALRA